MVVKIPMQLPFFLAGDHTHLTEVLHPKNDFLPLGFSLAFAKIKVGDTSLAHRLTQSETYIFIQGKGKIVIEGNAQVVKAGVVVWVPPNAEQKVINTGGEELTFYCIVSPPWTETEEEIL